MSPIATSFVTLLPPTGRTAVRNGEPSANIARAIVPAPMSATATPSSFSVSDRTASAEASPDATSSSILTPAAATHFERFWTAVAEPVTMWTSTSSRSALIPSGSLTPSWPSTLKPRRSTWRTSWFDGIETARATSIARLTSSRRDLLAGAADRDLAGRVQALDVLAADGDERPVDLPARQPLGALDRLGDRADRLVDVDDDALLETRRRDGPVAHDRQPAVAAHLADERADLGRADVDPDEDRFSLHRAPSVPPV